MNNRFAFTIRAVAALFVLLLAMNRVLAVEPAEFENPPDSAMATGY